MNRFRKIALAWAALGIALVPGSIWATQETNPAEPPDTLQAQCLDSYRQALGMYWSADYGAAEQAFQKLLQQEPENAVAYIYLADCQQAQGKKLPAAKNYEKAYNILAAKIKQRKEMGLEVIEPDIYADLLYCLNALGRYDEARAVGIRAMPRGQSADLYVNMAYTYSKLKKTQKAQANFCKSRRLKESEEIYNLTYQRLAALFENGRDWVSCPQTDQKKKGTNYALIIAVGNYRDPRIRPLKYAVNDARELHRILTNPRTGLFESSNVKILINERATEKNIMFKFDDLVEKAGQKEDLILIFYAGHGFTASNGDDSYWLTYDTIVGDWKGNRIQSTALSNLTLAKKLRTIKADTFVVFIDACFSSGMVTNPRAIRGLENYLRTAKNHVIITSSQADEPSIESSRLKHGLFSYYLIKGLAGEADTSADGKIEIEEIWQFVSSRVSDYAERSEKNQHPRLSGSSSREIFISKNPNL